MVYLAAHKFTKERILCVKCFDNNQNKELSVWTAEMPLGFQIRVG